MKGERLNERMKWVFLGLAALLLVPLPVAAKTLKPVIVEELKNNQHEFFPFYYWCMKYQVQNKGVYKPFLMEGNGSGFEVKKNKGNPPPDLESGSLDCFIPDSGYRGGGLNRSLETKSPDSKNSIFFYWNMTFANDENNVQLILKDEGKGSEDKLTVPVSSMGIVYPMFWNGLGDHFYFLVEDGRATDRSYGLWQFGVKNESFHFIGETNGRFFLSPDGNWIVWETGRLVESCHLNYPNHCVQLILYDIQENKNYQLTNGKLVNFFDHWRN